jgi:hypothetical protein
MAYYTAYMSSNINVSKSPKHFMVLYAIFRDVVDGDKIAKVTKIDKAEAEMILNDLAIQKLVVADQKTGLLSKKVQAHLTYNGRSLLSLKKQELEEKARELQAIYRNGDRRGFESFMDDYRVWVPMMILSGIMNTMLFTSMMSVMGMAMNSAEGAAIGRDNNGTTGDSEVATENQVPSDSGADTRAESMDVDRFGSGLGKI